MNRTSLWTVALMMMFFTGAAYGECENTCTTYPQSWVGVCPDGKRCLEFKNSCSYAVKLGYSIGCDKNGKPGAPTCNCTVGPTIASGHSIFWQILDGDDPSCKPNVVPACVTSGLAVIANDSATGAICSKGTRVEFTAGNHQDQYGKFDSYNIDVEKNWYSIPVVYRPNITCAHDSGLDCRPLWCNKVNCPDAYSTATTGLCPDNRSPQGNCQETFGNFGTQAGYVVEFCPSGCTTTDGACPSCQQSAACK
jgi:hypothetical protein